MPILYSAQFDVIIRGQSRNNKRIINISIKMSQATPAVGAQNYPSLRFPVRWSEHPRHLEYCLINRFSAQNYLLCLSVVCSLPSGSSLPELIYWQQHLGSHWVICPDANSSGWPISELWLSRTSVNELKVGMRWSVWKQLLHRLMLCEDCVSSLRSFYKHFYPELLESLGLNCEGAKDGGQKLEHWVGICLNN